HIIRCVFTTPFGSLVEPEVKRNLTIVSGPVAAFAAATSGPTLRSSSAANAVVSRPSMAPSVSTTPTSGWTRVVIARAYAAPLAKTRPGVSVARMCRSFALCDEGAIGCFLGPVREPVGQALRVRLQRFGGAEHAAAVGTSLDFDGEAAANLGFAILGSSRHDLLTLAARPSKKARTLLL